MGWRKPPASADNITREPDQMHVLFVLPIGEYYSHEWTGAIATITRQLARELIAQGHQVTVFTPDDGGTLYAEGDSERLRHGSARPQNPIIRKANSAWARLRGWNWHDYGPYIRSVTGQLRKRREPFDAIIVANDPLTADRLARGGYASDVVLWLHNRLAESEGRPFVTLDKRVQVVAVSQSVADWTRDRYLPETHIEVIHSGVDHDVFHPRRTWLEEHDPVRVICHGRIDPNTGQEVAAAAVARLRGAGLPVEITVVGEVRTFGFTKEQEVAYGQLVATAVAQADGTLLGWMPHAELAGELRRHDVACVLSRVHEPFALSTLEAMSSGCAVIGTRMGGTPEAVGSAGALVEPDSPDQVADVLEGWVRDRAELVAMKRAAVARATEFTWSATAESLVRILTA